MWLKNVRARIRTKDLFAEAANTVQSEPPLTNAEDLFHTNYRNDIIVLILWINSA